MGNNKAVVAGVIAVIAVVVIVAAVFVIVDNNNKEDSQSTATFNQNFEGAEDIVLKVNKGGYVESPLVLRDGAYITGWYADKDLKQPVSFPCKIDGDRTFYAGWTTSAAGKFFNVNYLTETASGIVKSESYKYTTGVKEMSYNGIIGNHVSNGNDHIVYLCSNGTSKEYVVLDSTTYEKLFSFSAENVVSVISNSDMRDYEFIQVVKADGYYVYDLNGNCIGPSSKAAQVILLDTLMINDGFYRFDSEGSLKYCFAYDANVHFPDGGNCNSFYEMEWMDIGGKKCGYAVNILDENFKVKNTFKFPANASHCACASLANGKFMVQYALEYVDGSSERYSFIDDDTRYTLKTFIIDEDKSNDKEIKFAFVIATAFDKANSKMHENYSVNVKSSIAVYTMTTGRYLQNTTRVVLIDNDGTLYDASYSLFSKVYRYINNTNTACVYTALSYLGNNLHIDLIDGSGDNFKLVLQDIVNVDSVKYFMKDGNTSIYDITGTVVGDYAGMEYVGATNNVLFFKDDIGVKAFRDGGWTTICSGTDITIGDSYYMYKDGDTYNICTENGTKIISTKYDFVREFSNSDGKHMIEVKAGEDVFKTFLLTTN